MTTLYRIQRRLLPALLGVMGVTGCVTISGNYTVTAVDDQGNPINAVFHVQGRNIYSARNGICATHPKAIVTIRLKETGKEVQSESPYQCK